MSNDVRTYVSEIQAIGAVPTVLEAVSSMTGLRFVCVAHVTDTSWTTCAVLDKLEFGLKPGDGLDVTTTLCEQVRDTGKPIFIDSVKGSVQYAGHHTPRIYGFQSYFSVPIVRSNGEYFGTLCGLDPLEASLSGAATTSTMKLFAELISLQLESEINLVETQTALLGERETSELREQFIAVLGHDLRTPIGSILTGVDLLKLKYADPKALPVLERIRRSAVRMSALVDDVVDFTRGKMGGGITLDMRHERALDVVLGQVVEELQGLYPERAIAASIQPGLSLLCDTGRMGQMLSNLVKNALVHGSADAPVRVTVASREGRFTLEVANSGPALPDHVKDQLFKPFWRAAPKVANEGLGLGLFIVAEIARSHGGSIEVVSIDGTTAFTFMVKDAGFVEPVL